MEESSPFSEFEKVLESTNIIVLENANKIKFAENSGYHLGTRYFEVRSLIIFSFWPLDLFLESFLTVGFVLEESSRFSEFEKV